MSDLGSLAGSAEPTQTHDEENVQSTVEEEQRDYADNLSDKDSDILSEIDEGQFEGHEDEPRPVEIDEDVAKTLKAPKRKVADTESSRKPKENRRPKKRARSATAPSEEVDEGASYDGERRPRKPRAPGVERPARKATPPEENEEDLTPAERRRRAIDRAVEAAVKNPVKRRRKKDDIDLEQQIDDQLANLKTRMETACQIDNDARDQDQPAVEKLKLLPEVSSMLNRTTFVESILDPETNFLEAVKYFLEPLNDGSLPAYTIQRDIFTALTKLPMNKDTLLSSGIGKVVVFYTKSLRAEPSVKRMAERLVAEWSRPILRRTDDYSKRAVETREYDAAAARRATPSASQPTGPAKSRHQLERERMLAPERVYYNRLLVPSLPPAYTVAPKSTFDPSQRPDFRPIGAAGSEAFRKMTQKKAKK